MNKEILDAITAISKLDKRAMDRVMSEYSKDIPELNTWLLEFGNLQKQEGYNSGKAAAKDHSHD